MAIYLQGGQLHQQGQQCQGKSGKTENIDHANQYIKQNETDILVSNSATLNRGKRRPLLLKGGAVMFKLEGCDFKSLDLTAYSVHTVCKKKSHADSSRIIEENRENN